MHLGKPLGVYSLSCPPKQGAIHGSRSVDMQGFVQSHSPRVHRQGSVRSASPALPSVSSQRQSRPLLINSVLSFVKAYRLKGDIESLKKECASNLAQLMLTMQRGCCGTIADKSLRLLVLFIMHVVALTNAVSLYLANIDNIILQAIVALDSTDLIPGIYCEATDLLRIPSLSLYRPYLREDRNYHSVTEESSCQD